MQKAVYLCLFVFLSCLSAIAQDASKQKSLTVGADVGFYLATTRATSTKLTPLVQAQFPLVKNFCLTTAAGLEVAFARSYYKEDLREALGTTVGLSVPVFFGGRYYIIQGLYSDLDLGAVIKLTELAKTSFLFSPGFGYVLPTRNKNFFTISTHYMTGFQHATSSFNFRFGYMFSL